MPAKDFKFISPGVFINEIDNSQLPRTAGQIGPAIIGRAQKGPALIPTRVDSFQEFVRVFGAPVPGTTNTDVSRRGNSVGPTYGAYAAQAWLRNNGPITYVRLVGKQDQDATSSNVENDGFAGWETSNLDPTPDATQGGAYGLWIVASGSTTQSGKLAAVWYFNTGSIALSGNVFTSSQVTGDNRLVDSTKPWSSTSKYMQADTNTAFKADVRTDNGATPTLSTKFNFDMSSENFIRKVFNTNPVLTNAKVTAAESLEDYWLGETYEDEINNLIDGVATTDIYGVVLPLDSGSANGGDFRRDYSDPKTGWFFSQDLTLDSAAYDATNMQKLFRFVAKNTGRWASRNIKISLRDIRAAANDFDDYGTFTVLVRAMDDTDNRPKILEQFNNCNLNPASENYVARKIGNKFLEWNDDDRRYVEFGDYPSNSDYIWIDMVSAVHEANTDPLLLPFGVFGGPRYIDFEDDAAADVQASFVTGAYDFALKESEAASEDGAGLWYSTKQLVSGANGITFSFPQLRLRISASEGNPVDPRDVYFGVDTTFNRNGRPSNTIGDYTGPRPGAFSEAQLYEASGPTLATGSIFTLDDMVNTDESAAGSAVSGTNVWASGSRHDNTSGLTYINDTSWRNVLDAGANQFTTVLHGGFDGLNIKESEPFRNTVWSTDITSPSETNCYTFNSVKIAIDSLRDPENVEFNLAAMPGITNNTLNRNLIDMCEKRGDALAVVDLQGGYEPETESTQSVQLRVGDVATTINNLKQNLQVNSSFGCAYYPWVQVQDTINGAQLWVPPSVAALGAMSYGQRTQELWFAPAGFTRGGLSANNAAGIPVVGVRERLVSKDRDKLYEANINPIAQFPAEGIVIFGQKTLQVTPSALDRINVRRLLIFLKRQISIAAATLLFDQNVQSTWNRFRSQVIPLLADVKSRLGLEDYKLILDETTTTPDLIDRNIMYAQVFLKPARSIEFIAIDFVITDSGASFED